MYSNFVKSSYLYSNNKFSTLTLHLETLHNLLIFPSVIRLSFINSNQYQNDVL